MTVSLDEALALLSKWKSESTSLFGIGFTDASGMRFNGSITALEPPRFLLAHTASNMTVLEMFFDLGSAIKLDYQDVREAPPSARAHFTGKVNALLVIEFAASKWLIFEREQPWPG